jgi:putative methyltransferase (TIGR04325 family)
MKISRKSFASYTDLEFNEFLVDKGKHFAEKFNDKRVIDSNSLKVVTAIGLLDKNVQILDVGGSVGTHHFLAKLLYPQKSFEWRIVENKSMVELQNQQEISAELKYYHDLSVAIEGFKPDLIILSSSLQYLDEPLKKLKVLANLGSKFLLITKTPMSKKGPITIIQTSNWNSNGPGEYAMPEKKRKLRNKCQILSFKEVLDILSVDYQVLMRFDEVEFKFARFRKAIPNVGLLLTSRH